MSWELVAACAVCFREAESPLSRGVVPATAILLGTVALTLAVIAGAGWLWFGRGEKS